MKNVLLIGVVALLCSSCSWIKSASVQAVLQNVALQGCAAETNAIASAAKSISSTLQCANVAAVQSSITAIVGNLNVCKLVSAAPSGNVQAQGVIANMICPLVASGMVGGLTMIIPPAWGCTATVAAGQVQAALVQACELAPI
jgi:hypothetical protein